MRRSLIVIPVAGAVAVGVAGLSGAFSSGHAGASSAGVARSSPAAATMPMPMPASATGVSGQLRVQLHKRVVKVQILNFAFVPARIEVSPGTRVVWTNEDSDPHTVTTDKPEFSSQALDTGRAFAKVLSHAGTFAYHCTIHPFMHGTVVVEG